MFSVACLWHIRETSVPHLVWSYRVSPSLPWFHCHSRRHWPVLSPTGLVACVVPPVLSATPLAAVVMTAGCSTYLNISSDPALLIPTVQPVYPKQYAQNSSIRHKSDILLNLLAVTHYVIHQDSYQRDSYQRWDDHWATHLANVHFREPTKASYNISFFLTS